MKNFICIITFVLSTSLFAQKQKHFLIAHEDTTDAQKFGYVFIWAYFCAIGYLYQKFTEKSTINYSNSQKN